VKRRVSLIRLVHQKEMYKLHNQIQQFVAVVGSAKVRLKSAPHEEFNSSRRNHQEDRMSIKALRGRSAKSSRERETRILGLSQGKAFFVNLVV